ncbi:vomeronasal type-1 receptor 48-like [Ctenodactylus gundi]
MNKSNPMHSNTTVRNTFYLEVAVGVSGNVILLVFHIRMWLLRQRPRLTDLPIGLLALTHIVMLLLMTGSIAPDIFMSQGRFWDDITCKSLIYSYRVMRGLSVCTTSLLSVLQAITLSPRSSCLAKLKHRSSCSQLCLLLFPWVFYTSVSSHLVISVTATSNRTSGNFLYVSEFCSIVPMSYFLQRAFSTLLLFREAFFMGLMVLSSGYMVVLLCRHKKQSQSLQCNKLTPKASPELQATWTILLLLSFFVVMSILDSFTTYLRTSFNNNPVVYCIHILVTHSYATVSPLVFIGAEKRIINFLSSRFGGQ